MRGTVAGLAGQYVAVSLDRPVGRFQSGRLRCHPLSLDRLAAGRCGARGLGSASGRRSLTIVALWMRQALADSRIAVLAPGAGVALAAALLNEDFPGDPADRLIYAAASQAGARLVTRDARIARFDPARVLW